MPGVVTTVRFKMPSAGAALFPSPGPKRTVPTYYSFNYGPVHFMNYDTEIPYDVGTPQWRCAPAGHSDRSRPWWRALCFSPAADAAAAGTWYIRVPTA